MVKTMLNTVPRMPKNDHDIQAATDAVNAQAAVLNQLADEHSALAEAMALKGEQCQRAHSHLTTLLDRKARLVRGEA